MIYGITYTEIFIGLFGLFYVVNTIYNICDWNTYIKEMENEQKEN